MTSKTEPWLRPFPRLFVEEGLVVKGWDELCPYYEKLGEWGIDCADDLGKWLGHWSELNCVADQFITSRYIDMTRHTDDQQKKSAYLECVTQVAPKITEWDDKLNRIYYDSPHRAELDSVKYARLDRMISVSLELFDEKNIPLQTQLQELSQQYQELMGAMMVDFDGREQTMPQMARYLREPDRATRQNAFIAMTNRRLKEKDRLDDLFDAMLERRASFSANLGLPDYRDYCFRSKLRDYTPDDCLKFHDAIEKTAIPLARKIAEHRKAQMGLDKLCPWDTQCDEKGRAPLKPFSDVEELKSGVTEIFMSVDKRLGERFASIHHSMDLDSRKGKAPGGYQATLAESRIPFIFTNAVGSNNDVNTLLHEGGHAFHTLQCRDNPLAWYRGAPMEFSEVASMTQELLGGEHLEIFYPAPEDRKRARQERLREVVDIFGWVARVDAFQHWIYTHPGHTRNEREKTWLALADRFSTGVDWTSAPPGAQESLWHRQLHLFELPFYYIEYAIAQLGALQVYRQYRRDSHGAINRFLSALALGGSKPAPGLFASAGIKFDFSTELMGELMADIEEELEL